MIFIYQRLVKILNKSETPRSVGCWWPSNPGVLCIYPQKPWLNRTPHQTGAVFGGKGKGMAFHTWGLPVSFPTWHTICGHLWQLPIGSLAWSCWFRSNGYNQSWRLIWNPAVHVLHCMNKWAYSFTPQNPQSPTSTWSIRHMSLMYTRIMWYSWKLSRTTWSYVFRK